MTESYYCTTSLLWGVGIGAIEFCVLGKDLSYCFNELSKVVKWLTYLPAKNELYFLGDLCNFGFVVAAVFRGEGSGWGCGGVLSFGLSLSFVSSLTLHFLAFDNLRSRLMRVVIPSCFGFSVLGWFHEFLNFNPASKLKECSGSGLNWEEYHTIYMIASKASS